MPRPHHYSYIERELIDAPSGRNDAHWVTHTSYGKESVYSGESASPYLLPNEWISGCLAQALRIPIPPFCMMKMGRRDPIMFTNLQFTPTRTPPPDAKPWICWQRNPRLCTGIVLFDIVIGNDDRSILNIAVDDPDDPREIICFDHDCAIASDLYNDASKRFRNRREDFLADNHCLVSEIRTDEHFNEWIGRFQSIERWFVEDICQEAIVTGFRESIARKAANFLFWRCQNIDDIVRRHKQKFVAVDSWGVV